MSDIPEGLPPLSSEQLAACKYVAPTASEHAEKRQYTLAYFWFAGYFILYGAYFYMGYHGTNADVLGSMKETLNYLTPLTGFVVGYFFNSSVSARRKDEALASVVTGTK